MVKSILMDEMPAISKLWRDNFCSITDVAMTKDLSIAKVFVMVGVGDTNSVILDLNKLSKLATNRLAQTKSFRRAPQVRFLVDEAHVQIRECELIKKILIDDEQAKT